MCCTDIAHMSGAITRTKQYTVGLLCIALVVCAGLLLYSRSAAASLPTFDLHTHDGLVQAESFWNKEIARVGGEKAYTEFLEFYATSTPQDQHTAAHIFGGSLFTDEGVPGLAVCDTSFSYGCFHEFLARAIQQNGLGSVDMLNEACFQALGPGKSLSCAHGLGHGIQSYLGYNNDALKKSLGICKTLPYGDPIGGCPGGVFMEFNMRTMGSTSGIPTRPLEPGGWYYPCNTLSVDDKAVCYYWQTQWWAQVLKGQGKNTDESFVTMGRLCESISSSYREKCFSGIGTLIGIDSDFDVEKAGTLCRETSPLESQQNVCLITGASSFFAEPTARARASGVCLNIAEPWYTRCVRSSLGKSEVPPPMGD